MMPAFIAGWFVGTRTKAESEEMYKATQEGAGGDGAGAQQPGAEPEQEGGGESKVEDVPFEEVK